MYIYIYRYLRGEQALEDEERTGVSSIGRVPSFYTSASSMNLSSLTTSPSNTAANATKTIKQPQNGPKSRRHHPDQPFRMSSDST